MTKTEIQQNVFDRRLFGWLCLPFVFLIPIMLKGCPLVNGVVLMVSHHLLEYVSMYSRIL